MEKIRRFRINRITVLAAVLLLSGTLAACGGADDQANGNEAEGGETEVPSEVEDAEEIVFGASVGLTGDFGFVGKDEAQGLRAAAAFINENGGILGKKVRLIIVDNESDPRIAANQVRSLVERSGAVAVSLDGTPTVAAAIPVAGDLEVPMFALGGAWPYGFSAEELKWVFGLVLTQTQLDEFTKFWTENGITRVGVIAADSPLANIVSAHFDELKEQGVDIELATFEKFPPGSTDLTPFVVNLRRSQPDFILSWTTGPDQATTIKTIRSLGLETPVGLIGGTTSPAFIDLVGGPETLDGIMSSAPPAQVSDFLPAGDQREEIERYFAAMEAAGFESKGGTTFATAGWDVLRQFQEAVEVAGSFDREAIRSALETQTFPGTQVTTERTPEDHSGRGTYVLVRFDVEEGWVPVSPDDE